jgi:hypothetical protein
MTTRPPKYQLPPSRTYTDLGWICAAVTGPAIFLAVWIYTAVAYGLLLGFLLGWIPALPLALLVAVAMIYLWPLAAVTVLYAVYRVSEIYPHLLNYIAAVVAICAIAIIWWWHMVWHDKT